MTTRAVASVHDVMPSTLDRVERILELLRRAGAETTTLLVVPGRKWSAGDLRRLERWGGAGHRLAGHGWSHRAPPPRGLRHRLHAALISRDRAEHLSRGREEVRGIVRRCHEWFERSGLARPDLYVPPAWALGPLTADDLRALPFRWYETLTGFVDAASGTRKLVPLVGFEADTPLRAAALRASNSANLGVARAWDRPVRVSLHPYDLELELARSPRTLLRRRWRWVDEAAVLT